MRNNPRFNRNALLTFLAGGRAKDYRPTGKRSLTVHLRGGDPVVRMYNTDIACFHDDGTITVNAGCWLDSMTTRQNIGEVTGLSVFTIDRHLKRHVSQDARAYAPGFPHGVPFRDGIKVRYGQVIWHPDMNEQKIGNMGLMTEEYHVEDEVAAKPYRDARRAFVKRVKHLLPFVSQENLPGNNPRNPTEWLEDILFSPPADEDLFAVLCQLVAIGQPKGRGYWANMSGFDEANVGNYLQRGLSVCSGPASWDILNELGAIKTERRLCVEV